MPSSVLERDRGSRFDSHSESKEKTEQRHEGYEGDGLEAWRGATGAKSAKLHLSLRASGGRPGLATP